MQTFPFIWHFYAQICDTVSSFGPSVQDVDKHDLAQRWDPKLVRGLEEREAKGKRLHSAKLKVASNL